MRAMLTASLFVCWSSLACVPPAREPSRGAPATGLRRIPLGLCEDYPEESRTLAGVRRDLDFLATMGIETLRVSIGWDGVEPEKDRYDFDFWDAFVDLAVREHGIELIPYVAYTPEWNATSAGPDFWKSPPRDLDEFGEIAGILAQRYHGRIRSWELWNEPDNADYWTGSAEQYVALLREGAEAIRAVDPELSVVTGGLAGRIEFLREAFELGAGEAADVVNLHSYYETWNPAPLETIPAYVAGAADIVRSYGGRQRIWMAEVGYGNYRDGSRVSAWTSAVFDYEHTLSYQAVALVRTLALLFSTPAISLVAWYELKDPPPSDAMIGDVNNRHLGVAFADYRPKPALRALSFMNQLFEHGFRNVGPELQVERLETRAQAAQVHGFISAKGSLLLIAWLPIDSSFAPSRSEAGMSHDARTVRLRIGAPFMQRGPAIYRNELGEPVGAPANTSDERSSPGTHVDVELQGGQVRIIEVPVAPL